MLSLPRKYLLRWRYDYPNGSKMGMWSNPGDRKANQAWCQNKEGLVRASIEGKDLVTKEIKTLAECDGHEFRVFQWMAAAKIPVGLRGSVKPASQLVGMKILTSEKEIAIFDTGQKAERNLPEGDKKLNFKTYGK